MVNLCLKTPKTMSVEEEDLDVTVPRPLYEVKVVEADWNLVFDGLKSLFEGTKAVTIIPDSWLEKEQWTRVSMPLSPQHLSNLVISDTGPRLDNSIFYYFDKADFEKYLIPSCDGSLRANLNVYGKYNNDDWLLHYDIAYHGTSEPNAIGASKTITDRKKSVHDLYGLGIYCTPDPRIALQQAKNNTYRIILQTFVDPKKKIVANEELKYWKFEEAEAIRLRSVWIYPDQTYEPSWI